MSDPVLLSCSHRMRELTPPQRPAAGRARCLDSVPDRRTHLARPGAPDSARRGPGTPLKARRRAHPAPSGRSARYRPLLPYGLVRGHVEVQAQVRARHGRIRDGARAQDTRYRIRQASAARTQESAGLPRPPSSADQKTKARRRADRTRLLGVRCLRPSCPALSRCDGFRPAAESVPAIRKSLSAQGRCGTRRVPRTRLVTERNRYIRTAPPPVISCLDSRNASGAR